MVTSMFCSPGVNVISLCFYSCEAKICFNVCILKGVPDLLFRSWVGCLNVRVESFYERQSKHRLLVLLQAGIGFEMNQDTSGADPVCRLVFQMNLDSIVFCSYLWLLWYE